MWADTETMSWGADAHAAALWADLQESLAEEEALEREVSERRCEAVLRTARLSMLARRAQELQGLLEFQEAPQGFGPAPFGAAVATAAGGGEAAADGSEDADQLLSLAYGRGSPRPEDHGRLRWAEAAAGEEDGDDGTSGLSLEEAKAELLGWNDAVRTVRELEAVLADRAQQVAALESELRRLPP